MCRWEPALLQWCEFSNGNNKFFINDLQWLNLNEKQRFLWSCFSKEFHCNLNRKLWFKENCTKFQCFANPLIFWEQLKAI